MIGQTQRHPEWRILVDRFREASYGDLLTHDDLAGLTGMQPETRRYYQQVSQARRVLLREHGIEIACEPKAGYRRVEPKEYGARARRQVRLGGRRIKTGRVIVSNAPGHLLSSDQVKELEHTMLLLGALQTHTAKVIRSMRNILPPVTARTPVPEAEASEDEATTH